MFSKNFRLLSFLALHVATLSILLSGCGLFTQKPSLQKSSQLDSHPVPHEYRLRDGTLELYSASRCSIKYKQAGAADYIKTMDKAESGKMIYLKPVSDSNDANGPDAIIEWLLKDGGCSNWSFSTHPKPRITNSIQTYNGHLQIAKGDAHTTFAVTDDVNLPNLGGARQVIVPIKLSWVKGQFRHVPPTTHCSMTTGELKAQAQEYKPLFGYCGGGAPPELAEAVLRLCSEGDEADAKKLLHFAWPKGDSGEQGCWKLLQDEMKATKIDSDSVDAK